MLTPDLVAPSRDRYGRPLVLGAPRQRASTFAKLLDTPGGLPAWAARTALQGLRGSDDLVAAIATTGLDDKRGWDALVNQAQERAQAKAGATVGTATHSGADMLDRGEDLGHLPEALKADVRAYGRARADLTPVAGELFVFSERFDVAGSLDRLFLTADGVPVIGDLKTSKDTSGARYNALAWAIQVAAYATGRPYCAERGLLDWADLDLPTPSLERGIILNVIRGAGACSRFTVDIAAGLHAADLAVRVRNARKYAFLTVE